MKKGHGCHSHPQVEGAVCTYQLPLREQGGTNPARSREGRNGRIDGGICHKGQVGLTCNSSCLEGSGPIIFKERLANGLVPFIVSDVVKAFCCRVLSEGPRVGACRQHRWHLAAAIMPLCITAGVWAYFSSGIPKKRKEGCCKSLDAGRKRRLFC